MPSADARTRIRRLAKIAGVIALIAGAVEVGRVLVGTNMHAVVVGQAYRSAQLSGPQLATVAQRYRIRTVVNLRGCYPNFDWYDAESRAAHDLGLSLEDVYLSATRLPPAGELRQLVEVIDRAEPPLLLHCRRGSDRTGLAAACVLLLTTDATVRQARRALSPRYGHVALSHTARMDELFDLYEDWLAGRPHCPDRFRHWVQQEYRAGVCSADLTVDLPASHKVGVPLGVPVRATNRSPLPWRMKPGTNAGVSLRGVIAGPDGTVVGVARAGLFDAVVRPGESIELVLPLPPLPVAGHYGLCLEMLDGRRGTFTQGGSEPVLKGLTVHD